MNKLSRLIKAQKDSLPESSKMNVVYKINCKDCDETNSYVKSYVKQTGRQ